jgi:hypothetical protein
MDEELASHPKIASAMGEQNMKNKENGAGEVFLSIENDIYALNPKLSHVPDEFASADPDFWRPQSRMLARTTLPAKRKEAATAKKD